MSNCSIRTTILSSQNLNTVSQVPGTTQLSPIVNYFIEKNLKKRDTQTSIDTLKQGIRNLADKNRRRISKMSDSNSDASSIKSFVTDPEPVESFTHYLFLKTDFSLSRLSRKLIMQLNSMNLNDDDDDEENNDQKPDRRNRSVDSAGSREDHGNKSRKRSLSLDDLGKGVKEDKSIHRLNYRPSCKKKNGKSLRNKQQYQDWLEDHHKKSQHHNSDEPGVTKIIRIDINEIDQIEGHDMRSVNYLDDLFKENNINKFYTFHNGKISKKSFYLATNESLSTNSLNSEMSVKTFARASIKKKNKKQKQVKKREQKKGPKVVVREKEDHHHNHHQHHNKEDHGHHHGHHHVNKTEHKSDDKKKAKKKPGLFRTATLNLIRGNKKNKEKNESSSSDIEFETEYSADLRSYATKKHEIKDGDLNLFLSSGRMNKRRNAIVHKIDTLYGDSELHTFMENLLRQDYIESFLL